MALMTIITLRSNSRLSFHLHETSPRSTLCFTMTLSAETESASLTRHKSRVVVLARHGIDTPQVTCRCIGAARRTTRLSRKGSRKQLDTYYGKPWDPPLSKGGFEQSRKMGRAVRQALEDLDLPPFSATYSSPFSRCIQTAAEATKGLSDQESLRVCVEDALVESINAAWYGSWCLPGADSTWGYRPKKSRWIRHALA